MRRFFFIGLILGSLAREGFGQLSQGGVPLDVPLLKSRPVPEICLPPLDIQSLEVASRQENPETVVLKPFRFAYGIDVAISPDQDGLWSYGINGYDVWRVMIRSSEAYSLSILFDSFQLPPGARLFLFNDQEGHRLGAFTSRNNKPSGKLAVLPVAGEIVTVQYEVPAGTDGRYDFVIREVGHDFVGVVKNERRPMKKTAGACNVDINCDLGSGWYDVKDATCRIIVSKPDQYGNPREFCSGTLINNTADNGKPYVLTAAHCFEKMAYAETSIYTFNYESPYCAPLDGDPSHSISGATLRAFSDSLDFALVELSVAPPAEFRAYYAGWDRRALSPDSSVSIHHPLGDIKKIAIDRDPALFDDFQSEYTPNGFHYITRWEHGVTEAGSSGGGLYSYDKQLIGSLTGGAATCYNPVNDYFSRFDLAWEYRPDSSKQLRYWLDPARKNPLVWSGKRIYPVEDICLAYTNLDDFDTHKNVIVRDQGVFVGYWGGSNQFGISSFAERFALPGSARIHGVSLGVGKMKFSDPSRNYQLRVKIYEGVDLPGRVLYSEDVNAKRMVSNVMNYIEFAESVQVPDTFFLGFELMNFLEPDTFVVLQSQRPSGSPNFYWYKKDQQWFNIQASINADYSIVSVLELVACGITGIPSDTPVVVNEAEFWLYPNPFAGLMTIESKHPFAAEDIRVFNLLGQEVSAGIIQSGDKSVQIDLSGNKPGNYFLRIQKGKDLWSHKVQFIP